MKTKELFYLNNKLSEFDARVLQCKFNGKYYEVLLDKTAFYPEGGGQPGDRGFLNDVEILDTIKKDDEIYHIAEKEILENMQVIGKIDYKRRFRFMQSHAGEHILSGVLNKLFGCDNVGFHIGSDFVTIDINQRLEEKELSEVEIFANRAIYSNIPIKVSYHNCKELENTDYRSKKKLDGEIRLVTIDKVDTCACCGIHCDTTGEVGIIKIITSQSYKGGTRIFFICGEDALIDYRDKNKSIYKISSVLSVKPNEVDLGVLKFKEDLNNIKYELALAKEEILKLKAEKFAKNSDVIIEFEENLSAGEVSKYALLLSMQSNMAFVFSKENDGLYRYAIASSILDVRNICKKINTSLNGKGGGKKDLVQGSIESGRENIEIAIKGILDECSKD